MFNSITPLNISQASPLPFYQFPGVVDESSDRGLDEVDVLHINTSFSYFRDRLQSNPVAIRWLGQRKITVTESLISEFQLGFSDGSLCRTFFPRSAGRSSEMARGCLQRLGILKPSGFEYFHGCVVFPFLDEENQIVEAYGRRISPESRKAKTYHHHWNTRQAFFFNLKALAEHEQIILCKSPLEALTLISAGIPNVVGLMGIFSFEEAHTRLLQRYGTKQIVLALDNSDTGNHISGLIAQVLETCGIDCLRVPLPKHTDINQFAQQHQDHEEALTELLNKRFPYEQTYEKLLKV